MKAAHCGVLSVQPRQGLKMKGKDKRTQVVPGKGAEQ